MDLAVLPQAPAALRWGATREHVQTVQIIRNSDAGDSTPDTDTTPSPVDIAGHRTRETLLSESGGVVIMPLARLLQHRAPDAAAIFAVLRAHCHFDHVSAHILHHTLSAMAVLESVIVDLAGRVFTSPASTPRPSTPAVSSAGSTACPPPVGIDGRDRSPDVPQKTVLHCIIEARARLALTSAQAVRFVQRLVAVAAHVLPVVDSESGKDAVTMATSLPHCREVARVLCEHSAAQFFSRYVFDDAHARPWRQRVGVVEVEGRDTVGGGAVVLRLYARRRAWETEISARELVPPKVLADAVWPVLACAVSQHRLFDVCISSSCAL